jgi:hypothetical protein
MFLRGGSQGRDSTSMSCQLFSGMALLSITIYLR